MTRAICNVASYCGRGTGASVLTIQFKAETDAKPELRGLVAEEMLPSLCAQDGIVSAQLWLADNTPTPATRERELRAVGDGSIDWAIVVDGVDADSVRSAANTVLSRTSTLKELTAKSHHRAIYQLLYSLDSRELPDATSHMKRLAGRG
jgi:hypothetical protein